MRTLNIEIGCNGIHHCTGCERLQVSKKNTRAARCGLFRKKLVCAGSLYVGGPEETYEATFNRLEGCQKSDTTYNPTGCISDEEKALVDAGLFIGAVKSYRDRHFCGLKEAVDAIRPYRDQVDLPRRLARAEEAYALAAREVLLAKQALTEAAQKREAGSLPDPTR